VQRIASHGKNWRQLAGYA